MFLTSICSIYIFPFLFGRQSQSQFGDSFLMPVVPRRTLGNPCGWGNKCLSGLFLFSWLLYMWWLMPPIFGHDNLHHEIRPVFVRSFFYHFSTLPSYSVASSKFSSDPDASRLIDKWEMLLLTLGLRHKEKSTDRNQRRALVEVFSFLFNLVLTRASLGDFLMHSNLTEEFKWIGWNI